jgi:hypothetical protein
MFARNSSSRAGLTDFTPDTVDTANQSIPTSAVRKYVKPRSLLLLTNILHSVRILQDRKISSIVRDANPQEIKGLYEPKDGHNSAERCDFYSATSTPLILMRLSDSPVREPYLCISVPTNDDPPDFLDDLAAAVEGITI